MFEPLEDLFTASHAVPTEAEADKLIAEQKRSWSGLLQQLRRGLAAAGESHALAAIDHLEMQIQNSVGMFVRPHDPQKGFVVSGRLPILMRSGTVIDDFAVTQPYETLGVILAEAGDGILEVLKSTGLQNNDLNALLRPAALLSANRYISERHSVDVRNQIDAAVKSALLSHAASVQEIADASVAALKEIKSKNNEFLTKYNQVGSEISDTLSSLKHNDNERIEAFNTEWSKFFGQSTKDIEAAKALALEAATFRSARQIWQGKKTKHSLTFGLGLALLATTVGFAILALIWNWQAVIAAIPRNAQGEPLTGYLIFIIIPLIAAAWILRIFARYVTNALTLGEDAEQRRAMLETYFSLVGNKDAKMEPSDRILILNAIFRPLPGHQSEDVAPPTLLDLTKEALSTKKGG